MLHDSALQKKRVFAEQRAERLKDPRLRVMGIDKNALEEQIREKESMGKLEKERDAYFDKQALLMDRHAQVLQREVDQARIQREKEIVKFRDTFQKKENSREWDLNNPTKVKKDLPARVSDTDPRCGAASLQRFEGEDLDMKERKAAQARQQREWVQQQADEKLMKKWMEKDANRMYDDRSEEMAYRTWCIEQQVAKQRAEMMKNTADFNKAVAEQKRLEKVAEKSRTTQKNLEEIHSMLNSDFLNETEGTITSLGEKTKRERFKGLTQQQRDQIFAEQEHQREQARLKKLQETEEERQQAQQEAMETRMGMALDRQRQRERREAALRLGEDHNNKQTNKQQQQQQTKFFT